MSISSAQSNVDRTQREIQSLNGKMTDEYKKEADRTDKINKAQQAVSRASSQSTLQSKLRDIERFQKEVAQIQKKRAELSKQISDKTTKLHAYQTDLSKAQAAEQKKVLDSLRRQQEQDRRAQESLFIRSAAPLMFGRSQGEALPEVKYDAFISHASEDKVDLVQPLADKLTEAGYRIWYDDFQLTVGDKLRRSIDKGLVNSKFGIVVLSPDFFAKEWPQYELDGLVNREVSEGGKVILPLWHRVSKDEVRGYSPTLADKVALNTAIYGLDEIVEQLAKVLGAPVTSADTV